MNSSGDLSKYNRIEIIRIIWETFGEKARLPGSSVATTGYTLLGNIDKRAFNKCKEEGLINQNDRPYHDNLPFKHILLKVYYSAINKGLILPSRLDQALTWNTDFGFFHFTTEGLKYFSNGFISIEDPGYLGASLKELQQRLKCIGNGQIELLIEAQRCVKSGCYRAGMIVIGVANEDICLDLLEAITKGCTPPGSGTHLSGDWNKVSNPALPFFSRWKSGIKILENIKKKLPKPKKEESWDKWWELIPGSLNTLGEAVRISRNTAAHDASKSFSQAEVALLLSAMPIQIEMVANITEFLTNPPTHVRPIEI